MNLLQKNIFQAFLAIALLSGNSPHIQAAQKQDPSQSPSVEDLTGNEQGTGGKEQKKEEGEMPGDEKPLDPSTSSEFKNRPSPTARSMEDKRDSQTAGKIVPVSNPAPTDEPAATPSKKVLSPEEEAKPREIGPIVRKIEIRFAGPKTTNETIILNNMRTKVGEPYAQNNSDSDVRALYATGFFSNVRVFQEPFEDGVKVVVVAQGKGKLKEVLFEGNKHYKASRLKKEVKALKAGETLSEKQVAEAANTLVEFYQKNGYHAVKVNFEINPDELTGQSIVKFIVTEGDRIKIDRVDFVGNKAFATKTLRKKIETRNHNWLSWFTKKGFIKETQLEEDKQKLADFYHSEGYIDAEVKDVKTEYPTKETAIITFFVFEGGTYKVGKMSVEGNQLFTRTEIDRKLAMKEGGLFTPGGLQKDIKAITDLYGARGYIDTVVKPTRIPNTQTGTMDLHLEVREGDLAYIDLIEIKGNVKTKDKVVRRELAVAPGEIYDTVKVEASKKRLENLGYFSKVTTSSENTDVPNRKNLVIEVEEQRTGSISFGAGFSSVDSIFGFVDVTQGNFDILNPPYFTGAGQKARMHVQFGARRQDYTVSFTEPWFMNMKLSLGGDIFYHEASYLSSNYDSRNYGFDIRLGRELGEFNRGELVYTLQEIELYNVSSTTPEILAEVGSRSKSSVGLVLTRDTRDSFTLPGHGYKTSFWSEVAGGPALGGQTHTYKLGVDEQLFFTMPWWEKNILSFNGSMGTTEKWDQGTRVPLLDKFFLGGPDSIRGFKFRDVGPKDGGDPIGGNTMAYLQTEYSIPVIDHIRFATFVDAGGAAAQSYAWDQIFIAAGAGLGLRLNLPIGSINLDYGWPIRHDSTQSSSGQFSFGGGTKF